MNSLINRTPVKRSKIIMSELKIINRKTSNMKMSLKNGIVVFTKIASKMHFQLIFTCYH